MSNKCPYCQKQMKSGYVQSSHQIYFNEGKRRVFASGDLKSKCISQFSLMKAPAVKAYCCEDCKKIVLDLE